MKHLEVIYNSESGKILTMKIHGKCDTVVPDGYISKIISYEPSMVKDIDGKLFDGANFVVDPAYVKPLLNSERVLMTKTFDELKEVLADLL